MRNKWFLIIVSFFAGVLFGAVAYAAVERDLQTSNFPESSLAGPAEVVAADTEAASYSGFASTVTDAAVTTADDKPDYWAAVDETLYQLNQRVSALETRLEEINTQTPVKTEVETRVSSTGGMDQETLVTAGVDPGTAASILQEQSQLEMKRLELRDQASREGWLDSERFFEELRALNGDVGVLRDEIGDEAYDRFLYLTGQPNRVVISSVIDQSPAQQAGIEAGDIVLDYADNRILAWSDLRNATREGSRGENILIQVLRNGETLELALPRGPLGVRLDSEQIDPDTAG